ncbi:hypothetical protein B0H17DRAFT_1195154 [Mycena rosella]|uniref:CxC2-like cysteine cluster KDZ transposase-associated domain-containing protein n=1 Tax=Mycena rosella TaxID=1033263 RepID=A0AAD7GQQ5_MYCRO|nr:hypothetical protein B0H17DRAFT_1195154 [Mycena rosella]
MADSDFTVFSDDNIAVAGILSLGSDSDATVYSSDNTLPKSLSEIDQEDAVSEPESADTNFYGNCEFCSTALGPTALFPCRFFRCVDCESAILCESCCYEMHLGVGVEWHRLEEWIIILEDWKSCSLWIPVADEGAELTAEMDSIYGIDEENARKRKSYAASDDPMSLFPPVQQLYLEETLWREGLGYSCESQIYALCNEPVGVAEWTGNFWKHTTLKLIDFVYQLGHGGFACRYPDPMICSLTVLDTSGVHEIRYRYCGCTRSEIASNKVRQFLRNGWYPGSATDPDTCAMFEVLDVFRLLNVVGNINAQDFIRALERKTDVTLTTGLQWLPDRYNVFLRISRQYAFLQRLRRAGRGHDPAGIKAKKPGECMVTCWACPYDGRNLPANWCDVDPKYWYLFRLLSAIDANFKMRNRICAREHDNPFLGPGWGAFVEPTKYKKHLSKYVAEKHISTCIAFAALTQKDTRNTTGLRVSGVGGVVCARHECMQPNGLGDLQKGERYANMDYILMSALSKFDLMELTLSYDIACQWKKNFTERLRKLPTELQIEFDNILVKSGLPVWHALAHEDSCAILNSLNYILGVGRTDGEGVERLWAFLNSCSYQSKEMGLGNRADTIEYKLDSHNFLKNLGQAHPSSGGIQRNKQSNLVGGPGDWQKIIDTFTADHSAPNPYFLPRTDGPTDAEIRASLTAEEKEATSKGQVPLHATSATAFLAAGLQLEDTQHRIKAEIASKNITADRKSKVQEQRLAFMTKLRKLRELQAVYTPGAIQQMKAEEAAHDSDKVPPQSENVCLWLPSGLPAAARTGSRCQRNVAAMEATMREGQCMNVLVAIRMRLHSKRFLINFRDDNITGQVKATCSQTIIGLLGDRVELVVKKYRDAWAALTVLKGVNYAPHLKLLQPSDLILESKDAGDPGKAAKSDREAQKKLGRIGAGTTACSLRSNASSKKTAGIS